MGHDGVPPLNTLLFAGPVPRTTWNTVLLPFSTFFYYVSVCTASDEAHEAIIIVTLFFQIEIGRVT